ncbi:hypothetical protein halTADL_0687 [Halohasta litchfieldiae]|jgi:hypothetical protein|uniref:Uncharacterized protein n=1 Tax=Halohasta litchfieldiae TaxID=1073996 RepID=A0A1H6V5R8_9EURY|nr:hypothetical protein [Halohasta litchfieldiae]ATW87486.1 hypothetical protein halTADL_0687 [Halohasta litchfieldiae]SEI99871.1 hypothetical protein SAMN05444271_11558 [Halohasta litchfieldiae]
MGDITAEQLPINAFAGIFLAATGIGVVLISGDLVRSGLFFAVGLFFLMRALAQYNADNADNTTSDGTD